MNACPRCGSNRVHRSRARTFWERFRRDFSQKRLFRCDACLWRGWGVDTGERRAALPDQVHETDPPDFKAIDAALARDEQTEGSGRITDPQRS